MRVIRNTYLEVFFLCLLMILLTAVTTPAQESQPTRGELHEIVLNIDPDQVVNQPLLVNAQIILFDSASSLVTDYDLAANPITLVTSEGSLEPNVLDDPALFNEGIISFLPANVVFSGSSGVVEVWATDGVLNSSSVFVSFNGYDILGAFDFKGDPITTIYAGLSTDTVNVTVQNRGTQVAGAAPYVKSYFKSGSGGSVKHYFTAQAGGAIDTVSFRLENTFVDPGEDTLVLELQSEYLIGDSLYATTHIMELPVTIYTPPTFTVAEGSFGPEAVYAGPDFPVDFDVLASEFPGQIDRTSLSIHLAEFDGGPIVATIYEGEPLHESYIDSVIAFRGLTARVDPLDSLNPGRYQLLFDFRLTSGEYTFSLTDAYPDSLLVLPEAGAEYVAGSFDPVAVAAGHEVSFAFTIGFDEGDLPLELLAEEAYFRIEDGTFSQTVNLIFPVDTVVDGSGPVVPVEIQTERLIIPAGLLGEQLRVEASFGYGSPDAANALTFITDFDSLLVSVEEFPAVQIIELTTIAPNKPNVNTGQIIQLLCRVASQSDSDLEFVELALSSDGNSLFDSSMTIANIPAYDTAEVYFDVTAGPEANEEELFTVEVVSGGHDILPPLDDQSRVVIQVPASLNLYYSLSNGAQDSLVEFGESFNLLVNLQNTGEGEVLPGAYRLTTDGVPFGLEDPKTGVIGQDTTLIFFMTAPEFDTTATISFAIDELPIEENTGEPAQIDVTSFSTVIQVASTVADLFVEPVPAASNLLTPGYSSDLVTLNLTNRGVSSITEMHLRTIEMSLVDLDGEPLNVRSILEIGNVGFYEGEEQVATAVAGQEKLVMYFEDFHLPASDMRSLKLTAKIQEGWRRSFRLLLEEEGIEAEFIDERMAGQTVVINSSVNDTFLVSDVFAASSVSLESSFMVRKNPWNPLVDGLLELSYFLAEPSGVEFRVFTLIGEEVYSVTLHEGEAGTSQGQQFIQWDGRNGEGETVLNGVYVAFLRVTASDEEATLKIAVIK